MPGTNDSDNLKQTGIILAAANVLLWPFYYADKKLGITASIVVTLGAVYAMHEMGKERRPVENTMQKAHAFFSPATPSTAIDNGYKNVIAGGAAICEELSKGTSARPS